MRLYLHIALTVTKFFVNVNHFIKKDNIGNSGKIEHKMQADELAYTKYRQNISLTVTAKKTRKFYNVGMHFKYIFAHAESPIIRLSSLLSWMISLTYLLFLGYQKGHNFRYT